MVDISKDLKKNYGDNILEDGDAILDEDIKVISFSPSLDIALSGGVPEGIIMTISGPPKYGKTTSALHFAANAQKEEFGEREVFFADVEARLKKMNVEGIPHLNLDKFHPIRSKQGQILQGEDFLKIVEDIIHNHPNSVIIIDSLSAICPSIVMTEALDKQHRAVQAKLISQFLDRVSNVIRVNKNIIIAMQHLMGNPSGYGGPIEKGGNSIIYHSDIRMRIMSSPYWEVDNKCIGRICNWRIDCSALGPPNSKVDSYIRFGKGIDELYELIDIGAAGGIVEKSGSWYKYKDVKIQGQNNFYQTLEANKELLDSFKKDVHDFVVSM